MNFDIDTAIIVVFLTVIGITGFITSRNVDTIKKYAIGNRDFSTSTLAVTLASTWIGGGFFMVTISNTYSDGLYYIVLALCEVVAFFVLSMLVAPRIGEFLDNFSVAEVMGKIYGKNAQVITALLGIGRSIGTIAIQFKVCSTIIQHFFEINDVYCTITACLLVISYSAAGGIKAVTVTDILQFITFIIFIPILSLIIWSNLENSSLISETITVNPLFNFEDLANLSGLKLYDFIALIILFIIPGLDPAIFHRIIAAKSAIQAKLSLNIAAFSFLLIVIITCWIAILLRADTSELLAENILGYIIEHYTYTGLKGLLVVGIMAMLMSTADSYINSASILLAHDFFLPLNIKWAKHNELLLAKLSALILGLFALCLALITNNLLEIILIMTSFYMPLVTVPLFLAIFGFRTSNKSYIFGIFVGAIITISGKFTDFGLTGPIITVISIILVALSILGFHYITNQNGGWIKSKDLRNRNNQNLSTGNIFASIRKIDFLKWLEINGPKNEISYTIIGLFFLSVVFSTMYTVPAPIAAKYSFLLSIIYYSVLAISAAFLLYPIWPQKFKNRKFDTFFWLIGLFYVLVLVGYLQVIISNFGQFQLIILLLGVIVLSSVVRWQIATAFTVLGVILSAEIFQWYTVNLTLDDSELENIQFKIVYLLLMIINILIAFLKPKQEHLEETEAKVEDLVSEVIELDHEVSGYRQQVSNLSEKVSHYSERVEDQAKEIERLGATAQKILNNVNHELRLPVGNVMNFAQMLGSGIDKMSAEEVKMISEEVYTNSTRLSTMILNMLDLAMLSAKKIELKKKTINFSELVEERVKTCRAIYLGNKKIDFRLTIEPEILIAVDPNYIRQVVDNIVINSINFSEQGKIEVTVGREDQFVKLTISDQGKGIPMAELYDIFTPFKMGSNSQSKAQGRGVGLALCKAAIEAHGGSIKAESNGTEGVKFTVLLPFYRISLEFKR